MWLLSEETGLVKPLLNIPLAAGETPYHSRPYQALPAVYAQNASLEIAWSKVIFDQKNISGTQIIGFQTQGLEGFDINTELDWMLANILISEKQVALPSISPIFW
jgi:N-acylneuraminate cytidylyltransferase